MISAHFLNMTDSEKLQIKNAAKRIAYTIKDVDPRIRKELFWEVSEILCGGRDVYPGMLIRQIAINYGKV